MEELVAEILKQIPSIQRLDFVAERVTKEDGTIYIRKDGKDVGLNDKVEGGYIREDGDGVPEERQVGSCITNAYMNQPYVLVIGFRKWKYVTYLNKLLGILYTRKFKTENVTFVTPRDRIIREETGKTTLNDSLQIVKIRFVMWTEIQGGLTSECLTLDCEQ